MIGILNRVCFLFATLLFAFNSTSVADESTSGLTTSVISKEKININTAGFLRLQMLPGVGPTEAESIIAARPFKSVNELKSVPGIDETRYNEISRYVTVSSGNVGAAPSSTRGADKASQRAQREIDREPPPPPSVPPLENRSTRGADKASQRPQRYIDQEPPALSSTRPLIFGSTRGADKASQRPQREVDREPSPTSNSSAGKVNINTANQLELEIVLGIDPQTAQAIIDNRPYKSKEDLMRVPGIKEDAYANFEDRLTVR